MRPDRDSALKTYHALLLKWQKAINLVSNNTLDEAWHRHFVDSLQLLNHLPAHKGKLIDIGSGAGFPGMVLAISCPEMQVELIESDARKCEFLWTVSRETATDVAIHNSRIESVLGPKTQADFITARALGDMSTLCGYMAPVFQANPDCTALLMKGRKAHDEINSACREGWLFDGQTCPSLTEENASIILIKNLTRRDKRAMG
jgi:16S rRNA (guanine527-N7)-methyltransferase